MAIILRDLTSGRTACVDTPDAGAVLGALGDRRLGPRLHPQHPLASPITPAATPRSRPRPAPSIVGPAEVTKIAPLDRAVVGGDEVMVGDTTVQA